MLPRFADIFQQGNRWLNRLEKQPEGSVRPVVIELRIFMEGDHPITPCVSIVVA
ncbi:TPA: hypothetical protein J1063_005127 [Escherichia coli]|nr:hypothetical protein [Escherichia coli]